LQVANASLITFAVLMLCAVLYYSSPAKFPIFASDEEEVDGDSLTFSSPATINSIYFWVVTVTTVGLGDYTDWPLAFFGDYVVTLAIMFISMGALGQFYNATSVLVLLWWEERGQAGGEGNQEETASLELEHGLDSDERGERPGTVMPEKSDRGEGVAANEVAGPTVTYIESGLILLP
jgi:hypothetical protein